MRLERDASAGATWYYLTHLLHVTVRRYTLGGAYLKDWAQGGTEIRSPLRFAGVGKMEIVVTWACEGVGKLCAATSLARANRLDTALSLAGVPVLVSA